MQSRNELGKLFQEHNELGIGAEVGCYAGDFSKTLSQDYKGKILAIDYFDSKDFLYDDKLEERCRETLKDTNCEVIKSDSIEYSKLVPDESLDWVYIDADHRYDTAKADIEVWFPKVRKGGVISGHDYIKDYIVSGQEFGVWKAVDEFCEKNGYKFKLITDLVSGANFASWWFIK